MRHEELSKRINEAIVGEHITDIVVEDLIIPGLKLVRQNVKTHNVVWGNDLTATGKDFG